MSTADRRTRIADAAVTVIAENGLRALTHRALDTALDLPSGSVSYYFRTRDALLTAVADRITERSRADFETAALELDGTRSTHDTGLPDSTEPSGETKRSGDAAPSEGTDHCPGRISPEPPLADVARGIAEWLDRLLLHRGDELLARHALILDGGTDPQVRDRLANSLFSVWRARELFSSWGIEAPRIAEDFVAVLEGAVFDRFAGRRRTLAPGSADSVGQLTGLVENFLHGARSRLPVAVTDHRG